MKNLKQLLHKMLIIGFEGQDILKNEKLTTQIQNGLGGVILFDHYIDDKTKAKNIHSPQQLKKLNQSLQNISENPLMICIDQEGGKVARLKEQKGFEVTKSAKTISSLSYDDAKIEWLDNTSFDILENEDHLQFVEMLSRVEQSKPEVLRALISKISGLNLHVSGLTTCML